MISFIKAYSHSRWMQLKPASIFGNDWKNVLILLKLFIKKLRDIKSLVTLGKLGWCDYRNGQELHKLHSLLTMIYSCPVTLKSLSKNTFHRIARVYCCSLLTRFKLWRIICISRCFLFCLDLYVLLYNHCQERKGSILAVVCSAENCNH